ncbi:MAG: class I SAM-dependent methyltransferase [Clostridia bacterium]|nr:class I SAM-dependent methyltransferase [Clostridia bacterium]MBQ6992000.1 class I SAM-dependent methyltransferase [Clostridia bacterium]
MSKITDEPDLYDILYKDLTDDIDLYCEILKDKKEVLELGAGSGRITIPLAKKGIKVIALDNSVNMLKKLRDRLNDDIINNIEIVHDDMITYIHPKRVSSILIPFSTFNYLLSQDEQKRCIETIARNLEENGELVMELILKKAFHNITQDDELYLTKSINEKNYLYEYWTNTKYNQDTNIIEQLRQFKIYENGNLINTISNIEWKNKIVEYQDIIKMLEDNFEKIEILGIDTSREEALGEYNQNCEYLIVKARRKKDEVNN